MALPTPRGQASQAVDQPSGDRDPRRQVVAWLNSDNIKEQVERALPAHVPFTWFLRVAQTAILNNPDLAKSDKASLLRELVAVAQLGLVLDPQLGEAWLIVDRNGKVQRRVGYQGLRKLALQSNQVTALNAQAVYENDHCEISLGDAPSVKHSLDIRARDRGPVIGCYAVGKVQGTEEPVVEWMSWAQIEEHRDRYSDAGRGKKSGPWADPLGEIEMGRKTVFRRLCKWLPKSPLLMDALADEDRAEQAMRDVTPGSETADALPASADDNGGDVPRGFAGVSQQVRARDVGEPAQSGEEKRSWTIEGKEYVQPGRVQSVLLGKIEACRTIEQIQIYQSDAWAEFFASLPMTHRAALESAIAHQRSVLEAQVRSGSHIPTTAAGRPSSEPDHPMAELDHLEDKSFEQDERDAAGKSQFDLLRE